MKIGNGKLKDKEELFYFSVFHFLSLLLYPYQSNFQFSISHFQLPIMITFVCCLIALIVGYFVYGKFIERIFGIDAKRQTPAYTHQDGVDYIPMPTWKVFMIQVSEHRPAVHIVAVNDEIPAFRHFTVCL